MEFEIDEFAGRFKDTIEWMLEDGHAQEIKDDLQYFKSHKDSLKNDPDSVDALGLIIRLLKTNSFRLKETKEFGTKLDAFIGNYGNNFRTSSAKDELIILVGNRNEKHIDLLFTYPTLEQFTNDLYASAKEGKTKVLGEKGRDNYLRDFGYWDRISIDIHEMRFIIRSGIYHTFSSIEKSVCV